jgi:hypothetical protein
VRLGRRPMVASWTTADESDVRVSSLTTGAETTDRRGRLGRPAVLFVDDGPLAPFVQLATFLRRSGWRTIRVTTAPRSIGSLYTASFAFDRAVYTDAAGIASLDTLLSVEHLVDVHATEPLAVEAYRSLDRRPDASRAGWRHRVDMIDKSRVTRLLDAAGIAHPDELPGTTPAGDAAAALGLPVVVKPRIGAFGTGVMVIESVEALDHHLDAVGRQAVVLQSFVEGRGVNYSAVVGEAAERDMTYRTVRRGTRAWSPSVEIECTDDERLLEIGRRLAEALPCQGVLNVDAIVDADGRFLVHDVNLRVFGAFFASRQAGFDLSGAYLRWLGDQLRPAMADGSTVDIYPDCVDDAIVMGGRRAGLRVLVDQTRAYARAFGSRYVLREIGRSVRGLLARPPRPS